MQGSLSRIKTLESCWYQLAPTDVILMIMWSRNPHSRLRFNDGKLKEA
jgi:hypothetical protein